MTAYELGDHIPPHVEEGPTGLHIWTSEDAYVSGADPEEVSFRLPDGNVWTWRSGTARPVMVVRNGQVRVVPVEEVQPGDEVVPEPCR